MLKIVAVIAIAAAIAYFAPQLTPAFLSTAIGTTAATAAVTAALSIAASAAVSALAGKPRADVPGPGVFRQSVANSFIIYGKRRVGGLLIFFHPVGKDYRYFVIAVAGHQCRGVVRWFLGDEQVTVDGSGKVTSGKYANNAWLWFYRGTPDQQAHPIFVAETGGKWSAQHRGRGTALIYAKFKMTDDVVQAGMPNITAEIEGKDTILDVRDDTVGYTRNAQLIFRDWMATPREEGGFGAYPDELDDTWDALNAGVCDEVVAIPNGTEKRYEFDAYITTGAAPSEIRDTFVTCCAGSFTYSGGKMLMRPGYFVPSSATLSEDDLAGPITIPALLAGDEIANEVTGTFIDPSTLYQAADVPTRSIYAPDVRQQAVDLPHITSIYRGQRILEYLLRKSNAERRVTWPMNIAGIAISTLDTVQIATARYGLSNYAFQVTGWGLSQDFSVVLQLEEHSPEMFEFDPAGYLQPGEVPTLVEAEPIGDASALQLAISTSFPIGLTITAADDGSVTISDHVRRYTDGHADVAVTGATIASGLSAGDSRSIGYDDGNRLGGEVIFQLVSSGYDAIASPDHPGRHYVGTATIPTAGSPPSSGGGAIPPGGYCVTIDTPLLIAPGVSKEAGSIVVGVDRMWTRHEDRIEAEGGGWGSFAVEALEIVESDDVWEATIGGKVLRATGDHLVYLSAWTKMRDVRGSRKLVGTYPVVKLTVTGAHTYVSNGILSHNIKATQAEG